MSSVGSRRQRACPSRRRAGCRPRRPRRRPSSSATSTSNPSRPTRRADDLGMIGAHRHPRDPGLPDPRQQVGRSLHRKPRADEGRRCAGQDQSRGDQQRRSPAQERQSSAPAAPLLRQGPGARRRSPPGRGRASRPHPPPRTSGRCAPPPSAVRSSDASARGDRAIVRLQGRAHHLGRVVDPRLDGPDGHAQGVRDLDRRHPQVVVQDQDGPLLRTQSSEGAVELVTVGHPAGRVADSRRPGGSP